MSALIGGRSGNRGLCAQPCRMTYRPDGGKTGHPLSLKDLSLCRRLGELRDMGAASLKIEGRMKRPEYVALVTGIYARLLREDRGPTAEELRQLTLAFSREGFTEGYYQGAVGPAMLGFRQEGGEKEAQALYAAAKAAYQKEDLRRVPVTFDCRIAAGEPARLTAGDGAGHTVTVLGETPEPALRRGLTREDAAARLSKTGGTAFQCAGVSAQVDEGLSLSAAALNALRRDALSALAEARTVPPERREYSLPPAPEDTASVPEPALSVSMAWGEQLTEELTELSPALLYLPAERIGDFSPALLRRCQGTELCAVLPRVCKDSELPELLRLVQKAKDRGCTSLAVQNIGQITLPASLGMAARGDFSLNLFNSFALAQCRDWGLQSACLSFELRQEQIRALRKPLPCEAIVYGRLPLMLTEHCLLSDSGQGCEVRKGAAVPCRRRSHGLTDRRGERFPILPVFGCRSELQNGRTLYLIDKSAVRSLGLAYLRLRFTTEDPADCASVLRRAMGREDGPPPRDLTRGLFYRGVD